MMTFDEAEKLAFEKAITLCKYPESGAAVLQVFQDGDNVDISVRSWFGAIHQLKQLEGTVKGNSYNNIAPFAFHVVSVDGWNDDEYDFSCADGVPRLCWPGYYDELLVASFPYDSPPETASPSPQVDDDDSSPF